MAEALATLLQHSAFFRRAARYEAVGRGARLADLPESRPITIPGRAPAVLAIHGYCGVPGEVQLVTDVAGQQGLAARAPCLAGHGTHPRDLAPLRFADWVAGLRADFDALRAEGPVILVGQSLGSMLATELYLSAPGDVAGLVLLANAFWIMEPFPGLALDWVDRIGAADFGFPKFATDLGDPAARASHVSYDIQPVHGAVSLRRAGERLREELFRVHCPTLILHGAKDQVTPVANAWRVAERLGTTDQRVVLLPRSHHIVTRDYDREVVRGELAAFFGRMASTV